MKIKFGALVVDGRGKIGGHVASRNKAGAYLRTKVTPLNPATGDQMTVRNNFTANAQGWKGLTVAQRKDWGTSVQNFTDTDIFGDSKTLSGFQLYVRLNNLLRFIGEGVITSPPVPASVPAFATFTATPDKTLGDCEIAFTDAIAVTEKVILYATPGLSAGVNFVKSEYRKIAILTSADLTPHDCFAAYETKFGTFPAVGTKIFFKARQITIASGLPGAYAQTSAVVV